MPEVLRAELSRPKWTHEHVALGTNTDPYQWVEGRYKLMPGIWEAFRDTGTPASVLTKSPLLLRDLELMRQVPDISAALSVPTLEEKAWRSTEPHTPHPRARLEAVGELNRAGIPTSVLIAPLMPGRQRLARAGRAHPRAGGGGGRGERRRHRAAPARRGEGHLLRLAALAAPGPAAALRAPVRARRLRAAGGAAAAGRAGAAGPGAGPARFSREAAERRAEAEAELAERRRREAPPEQPRLF